ncbi:hypothetical protein G6F24_017988 [Rhizopus arrhizus]|nr:hypothetical protein G6F24_017988 [Rhizopus arrhizus]
MLFDDYKRELFNYRSEFDQNVHCDGIYKDVFDGQVYRNLLLNERQLFRNQGDIALMLVVDGFVPRHNQTVTLTVVTCYIMNIDPAYRYVNTAFKRNGTYSLL